MPIFSVHNNGGIGASLPGIDAFSDITPFALDLKEKSFSSIVFINY
ncbi:hypothetical protein [Aminivibrio sp.]